MTAPVSIIIPAYNAEDTLTGTLISLQAQLDSRWEAIVVDDGSTDSTAAIAAQFAEKDRRLHVVSQTQQGEAGARNTGLRLARYDKLLFLDSDDWILPQHLQRMNQLLQRNPRIGAAYCRSARVAPDGRISGRTYFPPSGDLFAKCACFCPFPVHSCLIRRSVVELAGHFDTSLRTCSDWDFWQRVARLGTRFGAVNATLAHYRLRPHSAGKNGFQIAFDGLRVITQGHNPDPRIHRAHPSHAAGRPMEGLSAARLGLICWAAGLLLGLAQDARSLFQLVHDDQDPNLSPIVVARTIFTALHYPTCRLPDDAQELWPLVQEGVREFLGDLETHAGAPGLADQAGRILEALVLFYSRTDATFHQCVRRYCVVPYKLWDILPQLLLHRFKLCRG